MRFNRKVDFTGTDFEHHFENFLAQVFSQRKNQHVTFCTATLPSAGGPCQSIHDTSLSLTAHAKTPSQTKFTPGESCAHKYS